MRPSIHEANRCTIARLLRAAGLLLALAAIAPPAFGTAAEDTSALSGRLGGTFESFRSVYGEPMGANGAIGVEFAVEGFGVVAVQFDRRVAEAEPDDPALVITLSAPRPPTAPAVEPHAGDWSTAVAIDRSRSFLPTDVRLGPVTVEGSRLHAACESEALETTFGDLRSGRCALQLIAPTPATVSYAVLTLTGGAMGPGLAATPAADPCAGFAQWSQTAAARLDAAARLLQQVSAVDERAPDAAATLGENAAAFAGLAADQRTDQTPAEAAKANYFLISAFSTYADALETAAAAVSGADDALVEAAVDGIASAERAVARATVEIAATAAACGLETEPPATPD